MIRLKRKVVLFIFILSVAVTFNSCQEVEKFNDDNPEIVPLKQGFKTAAAIGYCVSLTATVLSGETLPANVVLNQTDVNRGVMIVTVDENNPLPFNNKIGDILIAYYVKSDPFDGKRSGVISIVFADLDIIGGSFEFYGIYTVPITQDISTNKIRTLFAKQDIILGQGSDTILNISLTNPKFDAELLRLNDERPSDVFTAVNQNVWFIDIDPHNTSDLYDDSLVINGGGQIVGGDNSSGGIQYHAMIGTEFRYDQCTQNPTRGDAFIQNIKAESTIDLGNIYLVFHDECDGKAHVHIAAGTYLPYIGRNVNLHFD